MAPYTVIRGGVHGGVHYLVVPTYIKFYFIPPCCVMLNIFFLLFNSKL